MTHLDRRIMDAWTATADWHAPNPAAAPDSVTAAEHAIGRRLPQAFRELYLVHDGGGWLGHNLNLLPLDDGNEASEGSVVRAAAPSSSPAARASPDRISTRSCGPAPRTTSSSRRTAR